MLSNALVALGLVGAGAHAQEARDPRVMIVESDEPRRPSATVYLYAGSCGRDRYEVEMRGSDRSNRGSEPSVRVNGNPIVAREMDKISALVPPGVYICEPVVDKCLEGVRQVRVRLLIAGAASPTPRWLSFQVAPDGLLTGFKEEKRAEIEGAEMLSETMPPRIMTKKRRGPTGPTAILYSVAGSCGRDRYEAELRRSGRAAESSIFSLRVNGLPMASTEMDRIEAAIPEGFAIDRAVVQECPKEVRQARIFLTLRAISSPEVGGLSFLVGPDGRVTGIR